MQNTVPKWTIVIPTIREVNIGQFLDAWKNEFTGQRVIVVEDNPEPTFKLGGWVEHYSWKDIDKELGKNSWIIPRRSDTVRSYGYYKAWQGSSPYVLTLDDDCLPEPDGYNPGFLNHMKTNLERNWEHDKWWNTLGTNGVRPRGFPYDIRDSQMKTMIHHGLWSNIPDLDSKTQKTMMDYRTSSAKRVRKVPTGKHFPMCGMNLAFRREIVPAMYFLLMGKDLNENPWPYDRFGDIWAGLFAKKICDHLGFSVSSGAPSVHHSKASNVEVNGVKEKPALPVNERLWKKVDEVNLKEDSVSGCYREFAEKLDMNDAYWKKLKKAMNIWTSLFV